MSKTTFWTLNLGRNLPQIRVEHMPLPKLSWPPPREEMMAWRTSIIASLKRALTEGEEPPGVLYCLCNPAGDNIVGAPNGPAVITLILQEFLNNGAHKDFLSCMLPETMRSTRCESLVLICDAYIRTPPAGIESPEDLTPEEVRALPKKEAALVSCEMHGDEARAYTFIYERDEDGKIASFSDDEVGIAGAVTGRLTGLLRGRYAPTADNVN